MLKKILIVMAIYISTISLAGPGGCLIGTGTGLIVSYLNDGETYIPIDAYCLIGDLIFPFSNKIKKDDVILPIKETNKILTEYNKKRNDIKKSNDDILKEYLKGN